MTSQSELITTLASNLLSCLQLSDTQSSHIFSFFSLNCCQPVKKFDLFSLFFFYLDHLDSDIQSFRFNRVAFVSHHFCICSGFWLFRDLQENIFTFWNCHVTNVLGFQISWILHFEKGKNSWGCSFLVWFKDGFFLWCLDVKCWRHCGKF